MTDKLEGRENQDSSRIHRAVEVGAEIAGGAVGGALGFLAAGPLVAAIAGAGGAALSKALVAVGEEVCERLLSPRETARVGAALAVSLDRTRERIEAGDELRADSFISDGTDRPPIEEVTEGLLLAAQRAYDEKKVPYIGRLSANLNFDLNIGLQASSVLVRFADQLSYQQLCLLRLVYENQHGNPILGGKYKYGFKSNAHAALLSDLLELERNGFINMDGIAVLGMTDIDPPRARLQAFGASLYQLMELGRIPIEDLIPLRDALERGNPIYISANATLEAPIVANAGGMEPIAGVVQSRRSPES